MTQPRGELTTYRARGGHTTDWANPTRSSLSTRGVFWQGVQSDGKLMAANMFLLVLKNYFGCFIGILYVYI